ncbi:3-(3-hydroxy-phenyl)propionate/3-hydroxycinnamic acid hydroxylase [Talaromyces islandicus]|uniref:3-(3-hydroxy-phenyl)propionate/3-hydroxycinnamic acid hydroxylase n=1 Tax=Talaromyces islandicus TaxID=28573 RepID=A0A0U1LVY9_TALIS|nr:3-(3-hydroxy-phenyl)propionate/3-hydroxycinnamic acid hydroxylase [Talaromyces islandicus]
MTAPVSTPGNRPSRSRGPLDKVIVVGAGPVGLIIALRLATVGIRVDVIEKNEKIDDKPRAVAYHGSALAVIKRTVVYKEAAELAFFGKGICWRKPLVPDGEGGMRLGDIIASLAFASNHETQDAHGNGVLYLPQSKLAKLFYKAALQTGLVNVYFNRELSEIHDSDDSVTVVAKTPGGDEETLNGMFLVGADGGKSTVRRVLDIPFKGHSLPERIVAIDVLLEDKNLDPMFPASMVIHPVNFGLVMPLEPVEPGKKTLYRCSIAIDPNETQSDDEIRSDSNLKSLLNRFAPGPRPLETEVVNSSVFRSHQVCALTMRKGRCVLAGDAAHLNNPFGALGLTTGLLDADALADALDLIINEDKPVDILDLYSDERTRVFQTFVDPMSSHNMLRCANDPETATQDWFLRALINKTPDILEGNHFSPTENYPSGVDLGLLGFPRDLKHVFMAPDIAIVGGGPCGLVLAGMLEQQGINYVVYERSAEDTPPRGGCLDIHRSSGQHALKEAGCFEEFKKYARGGYATIHSLWDHRGNKLFSFGEGRDSPEIDRSQLQRTLLSVIPKSKLRWSAAVKGAHRNDNGDVVLEFEDGTLATDFKLVVGTDGVRSKIRQLVTPAEPKYSDIIFLTMFIRPSNPYHTTLEQLAGQGPMVICGRSTMIWAQRQGYSHYRIDFGWKGPADFPAAGEVDLADDDAVKRFLLQDKYFGGHTPQLHEMIRAATGPYRTWPLYYFPVEELNWESAPGVTLVGDAAHVTTPFVGDGVNCAMRNALVLARKIKELGITAEAVADYEQEMFPYAQDVISRSVASGELFLAWDSPKGLMENLASASPLFHIQQDC